MGRFDVKEVGIDALFPDPEEDHYKRQGINKMCSLVRTALCDEHIHHVQFNCQDKKVLLDAQKHPEKHKELTGVTNRQILDNILFAAEFCADRGIELIIRCPLIPSLNDDEENIQATAEFVKNLSGSPLLNFLPYHNYGAAKYELLGKTYPTIDLKPQSA